METFIQVAPSVLVDSLRIQVGPRVKFVFSSGCRHVKIGGTKIAPAPQQRGSGAIVGLDHRVAICPREGAKPAVQPDGDRPPS